MAYCRKKGKILYIFKKKVPRTEFPFFKYFLEITLYLILKDGERLDLIWFVVCEALTHE